MSYKDQILGVITYLLIFLVLGITAILFNLSYTEITDVLLSVGEIDRAQEFKSQFFTPQTFLSLKYGLLFTSIVLLRFREKSQLFIEQLLVFFNWLVERLSHSWISLSIQQKRIVLVVSAALLIVRLLFIHYWEYYEDEAFSYQYLVSKGFLTTLSYYPGPNNHVLYNLLCVPLNYIGMPEVWVMRLPSVILSVFTFYVVLIGLKKIGDFNKAILASFLIQIAFNYFLYSFQGRGYVLMVLLVVVNLYSLLKLEKELKWEYQGLFVCSAVLGFYTIPVFIYPFSSIVLFGLFRNRIAFKKVVVLGVVIAIGVLMCYAPIVLVSGYKSIIANDWVKPIPFLTVLAQYPSYILGLNDWLWDFPTYGIFISFPLIALTIYKLKNEKWFWIGLLSVALPFVLILIQGVLPFPRIWIYGVVIQVFCLMLFLQFFSSRYILFLAIILFCLAQGYSFLILL